MDILKTIGLVAPTLSKLMAKDTPGAFEEAVKALGLKPEATMDNLAEALKNPTFEQFSALQKLELEKSRIELASQKVSVGDTQDARQMEQKDRFMKWLTVYVISWFPLALILVTLISEEVRRDPVFINLLNLVTSSLLVVLGFWFGTSYMSKKKDDTIASQAKSLSE